MHNPLEDPVPDDPIQRVHAFARDLAYGAITDLWSSRLKLSTKSSSFADYEFEQWANARNEKLLFEVARKWESHFPSSTLLVSLGYLTQTDREHYHITDKAFTLLEQPAPASVFISYRRQESSAFALLLLARFKAHGLEPFLDMNIEPGEDWHAELEQQVVTCEHLIALLGPATLTSAYVREEIVWAMNTRARIIPVWHNGFDEAQLAQYQAQYPALAAFFGKQAIKVEQENPAAYETAIIQILNRFGIMPG
jgi:hypothetical protein